MELVPLHLPVTGDRPTPNGFNYSFLNFRLPAACARSPWVVGVKQLLVEVDVLVRSRADLDRGGQSDGTFCMEQFGRV